MPEPSDDSLVLRPIATVHSPLRARSEAPHQGTVNVGRAAPREVAGEIELHQTCPAEALRDIAGFDYIWVIYGFHRNSGWKALVHAPRGPRVKRGVLATRSPHRPSGLGLTAVRLVAVEGRVLRVSGLDMLDGTPVYDLKPYIPYADAFPTAKAGWVDEVDAMEPTARPGEPTPGRKPRIGRKLGLDRKPGS